MAKVGFIGLGTMGASMAYNCLRGGNAMVVHSVSAHKRWPQPPQPSKTARPLG